MRKTLVSGILCIVLIVTPWALPVGAEGPQFAQRVAMRCKGEAPWAIALCACVVRNRLAGGWDEANVLDAFYAADVPVSSTEADLAHRVLTGAWPCDARLWFMFGAGDLALLGLDPLGALVVTAHEERWAYLYDKGALGD